MNDSGHDGVLSNAGTASSVYIEKLNALLTKINDIVKLPMRRAE